MSSFFSLSKLLLTCNFFVLILSSLESTVQSSSIQEEEDKLFPPWNIDFVRGASRTTYDDETKRVSFNFTRTVGRKNVIVTIYERGCTEKIYTTNDDPSADMSENNKGNNNNMISSVEILTDDTVSPDNIDDDIPFGVIVNLDPNIESSSLFTRHNDFTSASIDFCIRVDLVVPVLDKSKNVSVNFSDVEYKMNLKIDWTPTLYNFGSVIKYRLVSSSTGRKSLPTPPKTTRSSDEVDDPTKKEL